MIDISLPALADLPADQLTARLYELRRKERHLLVEFLTYLAELDRRRTYLELGFSSLFSFCTDHLGLTRSAAFRRTTAARLLARFPDLADYLADGRLCLTTLVELRDVLQEGRLEEVLARAAGRTEEQVKVLVATLRPREAPADLLRRLTATATPAPSADPAPTIQASSAGPALDTPAPKTGPETAAAEPGASLTSQPPAARPQRPAARVTPVSEELRVLRMTVGRDFVSDLEAVRAALSHQIPDGNFEKILHHCVRLALKDCQRRRRGSGRARRARTQQTSPAPTSRYISAADRDEVWRRDESRCAFIGRDGHRCGSTHQLELHHLVPFARGGASTVTNLSLRCKIHNRYHAEQDYGAEHIARAVAARQPSLL